MDQFFERRLDNNTVQTLAQEWRRRFQTNKEEGISEILQFFVKCCGTADIECDKDNIVDDETRSELVGRIEDEMASKPDVYPVGTLSFHDFQVNLIRFFSKWAEVVLPETFIDPICQQFYDFLILLSDCGSKAVRLTSIVALSQVGTEIIAASENLHGSLHLQTLKEHTQDFITRVFSIRYIDGSWRVRLIVMKEIAKWFARHIDSISAETLLKYVFTNITDEVVTIRQECANILNDFVSDLDDMPEFLLDEIQRKKSVLIEMTFENSSHVACPAIALITNIFTLSPELFNVDDHRAIMMNIYDTDPLIAKQAAKFFAATFPTTMNTTIEKLEFIFTYFQSIECHPEILGAVLYGELQPLSQFEDIAAHIQATEDPAVALRYFKLVTYAAAALSQEDNSSTGPKRKKRRVEENEVNKSAFVRAFQNRIADIIGKYGNLNPDWTLTSAVFYKAYDSILAEELPDF